MDTKNKNQARLRLVVDKDSDGYRSGLKSWRDTPDTASSCRTLSAGTRLALTHLFTACGYMPSALANARCPPLARMARSIDVSMRRLSTSGSQLSTIGCNALAGQPSAPYCLPMIDMRLVSSFGELLDKMIQKKDTTAAKAAGVLGCNRQMISKYIKNGYRPAKDKLKKFAESFGYDYDELIKLTFGGAVQSPGTPGEFTVRTERGALVGRTFENISDDHVRAAIYELLLSINKDFKKTGSD